MEAGWVQGTRLQDNYLLNTVKKSRDCEVVGDRRDLETDLGGKIKVMMGQTLAGSCPCGGTRSHQGVDKEPLQRPLQTR